MTRSLEHPVTGETTRPRQDRIGDLAGILSAGPTSFEIPRIARRVNPRKVKPFDGGKLAIPYAEPDWDDFKPPHSNKFGSSLPAYKKAHQMSVLKYRLALADWRKRERARIEEYNAAKAAYDEAMRERITAHNQRAQRVNDGVRNGDPRSVVSYVQAALSAESVFPEWLRVHRVLDYRPSARELTMHLELPPRDVLPEGSYEERAEMYEELIVAVTLRCLRECFLAGPPRIVNRARVIASVQGRRLVHVRAERSAFNDLNIEQLDPVYALHQCGARISPDPYALVPIPD